MDRIRAAIDVNVFFKDGDIEEARVLVVDVVHFKEYSLFRETLVISFPSLRNSIFKVSCKDEHGNEFLISTSHQGFITKSSRMYHCMRVLYVTVIQHCTDYILFDVDTYMDGSTVCGLCSRRFSGIVHFKCLVCPGLYLCSICDINGHTYIRRKCEVKQPDLFEQFGQLSLSHTRKADPVEHAHSSNQGGPFRSNNQPGYNLGEANMPLEQLANNSVYSSGEFIQYSDQILRLTENTIEPKRTCIDDERFNITVHNVQNESFGIPNENDNVGKADELAVEEAVQQNASSQFQRSSVMYACFHQPRQN